MRRALISAAFALVVASVSFAAPGTAFAGPPTDAVKGKQTELFKLLEKGSDDANQKRIAAIFDEMLDYNGLAEASLGSEWKGLKDAERAEFVALLKQLVRKAYERNLKKIVAYDVSYVSEESAGDKGWLVKTKAKNRNDAHEDPIEINFRLVDKGGKFMVGDIVTEDVSLVDSYRSQFVKIIKKDGYAALATKMKEKIAKGE